MVSHELEAPAGTRYGTLDHVLPRPIMPDKVEISRRKIGQRMAEIPDHAHRFQKDLWKQDGGAQIEIDASAIELRHEGRQQPEISMASFANGPTLTGLWSACATHSGVASATSKAAVSGVWCSCC